MNEITINVKIEGLDQLTEVLALLTSGIAHTKGMTKTAEAVDSIGTSKLKDVDIKDKETAEEIFDTEITQEQIRKTFVSVNNIDTRSTLKELLNKYNASSVSDLAKEHYPAIMKELEALK